MHLFFSGPGFRNGLHNGENRGVEKFWYPESFGGEMSLAMTSCFGVMPLSSFTTSRTSSFSLTSMIFPI